jgi:hypothetical protein
MRKLLMSAALAPLLLLSQAGGLAAAEEKSKGRPSYPSVSGSISVELQNDTTYHNDDPDEERNDLYTTTEPEIIFTLMKGLTIRALATLEPVSDPQPREDRVFEDHGMYIADLELAFERDWFRFHAGKYTVNFGRAWDITPGVYGTDFAEDYELAERIGFGASVTIGNSAVGSHTIGIDTFFLDTSILAESAPQRRDRTFLSQGGPANTEDFSSFGISLDGADMPYLPGLSYHIAYAHQAPGKEGGDSEPNRLVALGLAYSFEYAGFTFNPMIEYVKNVNAEGVRDQETSYGTIGLGVEWGRWNAAIANTWRYTHVPGGTDNDDNNFQISAGYAFDFGLSVDLGWKLTEEAQIESQTFGILAAYSYEF